MQKLLRIIIIIFLFIIWLFYALGFLVIGLFGFYAEVSESGFRATLCGSTGCSNIEFSLLILWMVGVIFVTYILPLILIIYFIRKRRKRE